MPWSRAQPRVAWFGKLPGQGDFVGRRMPRAMSGAWDEWLSHGLGHLRSTAHGDWERTFTQSPLWSFVASGSRVPRRRAACSRPASTAWGAVIRSR